MFLEVLNTILLYNFWLIVTSLAKVTCQSNSHYDEFCCCIECQYNIGIKHGFSCINIRQVPREVLKTEAGGRGFQHLPRDLANVNALKTMFDRYYCIKTENICYISRYFLHYFVSPFHRCFANVISTDYARSKAGQCTSRNGRKSVAPVRAYWKLRSRALTARELPC